MSNSEINTKTERPIAPKPDEVKMGFSEKAVSELNALFTHYPDKKSCILPALWIAQREYGSITPEAIEEVAVRLNRPYVEVEGVATFYTMYHKHKPGKHVIEICSCLTCAVKGSFRLLDYLNEKLGIKPGETTEDGLITVEEVECLDLCGSAPVAQIGDVYEGNLTTEKLDMIIERLRKQEVSTVTQLSNSVVKCHLRDDETK